jgi:hypothetical protein
MASWLMALVGTKTRWTHELVPILKYARPACAVSPAHAYAWPHAFIADSIVLTRERTALRPFASYSLEALATTLV